MEVEVDDDGFHNSCIEAIVVDFIRGRAQPW